MVASAGTYFILLICSALFISGTYQGRYHNYHKIHIFLGPWGAYALWWMLLLCVCIISLLHIMAFVDPYTNKTSTSEHNSAIGSAIGNNRDSTNYSMSTIQVQPSTTLEESVAEMTTQSVSTSAVENV
jgi:hypothetical protein